MKFLVNNLVFIYVSIGFYVILCNFKFTHFSHSILFIQNFGIFKKFQIVSSIDCIAILLITYKQLSELTNQTYQ